MMHSMENPMMREFAEMTLMLPVIGTVLTFFGAPVGLTAALGRYSLNGFSSPFLCKLYDHGGTSDVEFAEMVLMLPVIGSVHIFFGAP